MRAVVITEPGGPDVLKIQEVPDPTPGPDDVLVEVKASALKPESTDGQGWTGRGHWKGERK